MPGTARGRDPATEEEFVGSLYRGGELLAAGKVIEAREHLEKAHALAPKNEKAQNLLGLTYFKLGLFDQAASVYELLVRENPADPTLRVNLGLVYLKTSNLERAIKEFETATDLEPGHTKAHNYLGLGLAQVGEYAKAREHFIAAGSEQMAEKMEKALASRAASQPSSPGLILPASNPPVSRAPAAPQAAVRPAVAAPATEQAPAPHEDAIEVMSDDEPPPEEPPADVEVETQSTSSLRRPPQTVVIEETPVSPSLASDWGAQLPARAQPPPVEEEEMRFAEDEGPPALLNDAPLVPIESNAEHVDVPTQPLPAAPDPLASESADMPMLDATAVEVEVVTFEKPVGTPAWLTQQPAQEFAQGSEGATWVTEGVSEVPYETEQTDLPPAPSEETWSQQAAPLPADGWQAPELQQVVTQMSDGAPAPGEAASTGDAEPFAQDPSHSYSSGSPQAYDAQYAADTYETAPTSSAGDEPSSTEHDAHWVAQPLAEAVLPDAQADLSDAERSAAAVRDEPYDAPATFQSEPSQVAQAYAEATESWASPQWDQPAQPTEYTADSYDQTGEPPPETAPQATWEPPSEVAPAYDGYVEPVPHAPGVADGFAAMNTQKLVDLGATTAWVQQPEAGPFQLGPQGLAVTVTSEMLVRMTGLVAVVGSVQVAPETRRKRGRSTTEPFGNGPAQLQRVTGHGVLYLETGARQFHSIDLTDQPGSAIDDEGAYIREDLVFAFEEAVSFENGRLASDPALSVDLVHLKGHGRVLLQLDGSLKAMPIPAGAPMVVPLHRLVGWFGRVTPRLMGFGGQGAVELTGDGFALLGTPPASYA